MPELPEVETVVKSLRNLLNKPTISEVLVYWDKIIANQSVTDFQRLLKNQTIKKIERQGKYIIVKLTDYTLLIHLRMEGKFYYYKKPVLKEKHSYVIFKFTNQSELHYHDTRKFGKMYLYHKSEPLLALNNLGLEIWDRAMSPVYLKDKFKNKSLAIKSALLDQSIIAGIGNIYASEICFLLKLDPLTPAKNLNLKQLEQLIIVTKDVLERAIVAGGTTISSFESSKGVSGYFQQQLYVYQREGEACRICGTTLLKRKINQRGTVYCPTCQKVDPI